MIICPIVQIFYVILFAYNTIIISNDLSIVIGLYEMIYFVNLN